jgi:hypothetical protein
MVQSRLPIPANACFDGDEMRAPDVLYIGYPKTASTFIREFLEFHPDVYVDQRARGYVTAPEGMVFGDEDIAAAAGARCYLSMSEKIAEGVVFDDSFPWNETMFDVSASDRLHGHLEVSPSHWAQALRARFPRAKALIVIRDQVDWLGSAYRYYVSQLAKDRRSFLDFCETPKGIALLRAGHYDLTIRAYREAFGADSVMVLRYETLRDDRARFLDDLCRFLDVDPILFEGAPANVGRSALVASLHAHAPWAGSLPRPVRGAVKTVADKIARRAKVASLSESEQRFIRSAFAASNLNTEALLAAPKAVSQQVAS